LRWLVVISAAPALFIALLPLTWHVAADHRAMQVDRVEAAVEANRAAAVTALDIRSVPQAQAVAIQVALSADATLVRLTDIDGLLLAQASRPESASQSLELLPAWQRSVISRLPEISLAAIRTTRMLDINGDPVGAIEVVAVPPPILTAAFMPLVRALLFMLPVVILLFAVMARMQRQIVSPVSHLLETMDQVAHAQDYSIRATIRGPDEIGSLTVSFNTMLQQIDTRNKHLADHRRKLQELVIERTKSFEEAARHAEKASRAKGDFLARMSHEIRTPMNGVVGMAELLENTELVDQQQRMVQTMRSSADALLDIINDILDFSKIEAGQLQVLETAFSPVEILEEVCELLAPQAHQREL
jgi:signal transduction histidine kinase